MRCGRPAGGGNLTAPSWPLAWLRPRAIATLALGVAFAFVLGTTGALAPDAVAAYASQSALTKVSGSVALSHGGDIFSVAHEGDVLVAGDTIRTAQGASAEITYFEGSSVRLEDNTELVVEALQTEPDGGTVIAMAQTIGRTWHVVTKLISGSSRYDVKTPTSTASVRGTIFSVDVRVDEDGAAATVTTSDGVVVHSALDARSPGAATEVRVLAGQRSTMTKTAKAPEAPRPADPRTLREAPARPARAVHHASAARPLVAVALAPVVTRQQIRAPEDKRPVQPVIPTRDRERQRPSKRGRR